MIEPLADGSRWHLYRGDCIEHMAELPQACFDFAVFSPPFPSLFAYTDLAEDIGNTDDVEGEGRLHLSWFYRQLVRVMKPGRVVMVHVMQIPCLERSGKEGLIDFRGLNIRIGQRSGLIYDYDWLIGKNPQAQAIRTRSHSLMFVTMERDRAKIRGTLGDYLIKYRIPGENAVPIDSEGQVTRNDWISWAEACWPWTDIRETDTLNVAAGRDQKDTKHICPLQLPVIRRLVKMYSNPDEIVFSPFAGIGSEGVEALKAGRRFYGCEIKDSYVKAARANLTKTVAKEEDQMVLFR